VYYNLPSASGVTLTAAQYRELPVTCPKDTGGDAVAATELIQTGDTTGPVRAPLLPLDDAATGELAALLDHATLGGSAR
jgi:dihydrodipicolinate synthase/N-acetylneuraminate lyase